MACSLGIANARDRKPTPSPPFSATIQVPLPSTKSLWGITTCPRISNPDREQLVPAGTWEANRLTSY